MPAMCPKERSRGVATVAAIVSGLDPANEADTEIVGKSTWGSGETGRRLNEIIPDIAIPIVSSVVATKRRINGALIFIAGQYLLNFCFSGKTSVANDQMRDRSQV